MPLAMMVMAARTTTNKMKMMRLEAVCSSDVEL